MPRYYPDVASAHDSRRRYIVARFKSEHLGPDQPVPGGGDHGAADEIASGRARDRLEASGLRTGSDALHAPGGGALSALTLYHSERSPEYRRIASLLG